MNRSIERSLFLAISSTLGISLAAGAFWYSLNPRFMNSIPAGYAVFVLAPLLAAVPLSPLAWLLSLISPLDGRRHATRVATLVAAIASVPAALFLVHPELTALLENYLLALFFELLFATVLCLGCFRLAQLLPDRILVDGRPKWSLTVALAFILVASIPIASCRATRPISEDGGGHLFVFCMDGATWEIIDPLIAEGDLPALSRLMKEGTRFDLESMDPMMSPILWTTIASGVSPRKHGALSFYASSDDVTVPRIWDISQQNGGTVGVFGWPVTWPPRKVNGFLIPSLFARGPETYPPALQFIREIAIREKQQVRDLRRYVHFGVRSLQTGLKLTTLLEAVRVLLSKHDFLERTRQVRFLKMRMHTDFFLALWERYRPTFSAFYDNAPDAMSHYFWKYFEPGRYPDVTAEDARRYGDAIPQAYRLADAALSEILHFLPRDLQIVVVSDHGAQGIQTEAEGTIRLIHAEDFLIAFGLSDDYLAINLRSLVYLRPKNRDARVPDELRDSIESVTIGETGERVFRTAADHLGNLQINVLGDVDLEQKHLLLPDGREVPVEAIIEETLARMSGVHSLNAILLIRGHGSAMGAHGGKARLLDVAPTIVYMMGFPLHDEMEGSVLTQAVAGDSGHVPPQESRSYTPGSSPDAGPTESGDEELKRQLRALGYIQ